MTDKTKPWLSAKHPEAIACKAAGKKLFEELKKSNIDLTGIGVGTSVDNQKAVIRIYLLSEKDIKKVPTTFENFEVHTEVTGEIVPL